MSFKKYLIKTWMVTCIALPTTGLAIDVDTVLKGPVLNALAYLITYQEGNPKSIRSELQQSVNTAAALNGLACTIAIGTHNDYNSQEQVAFVASAAATNFILEKLLFETKLGKEFLQKDPYYSKTILKMLVSFAAGEVVGTLLPEKK
jgi:hypothetical protein